MTTGSAWAGSSPWSPAGSQLQETGDGEPAGEAGVASGRQDVVGAGHALVGVGHRRPGSEEERAVLVRWSRYHGGRRPGPRGAPAPGCPSRRRPARDSRPDRWTRSSRRPGDLTRRRSDSCRSIGGHLAARRLDVVTRQAGEVGPCSAWPRRSAATIWVVTVSSAMTATSDGPARTSMPTCPNAWRFASAT